MQISSITSHKLLFPVFLGICISLGFFFRVNGLSNGGFSNSDEYYIAKSVHNILEYGVPQYPLGGYYTRGLIYQYLSALLLLAGIKAEYALRIIPLIFNILALPALYLLGKKIGGKIIGISILFLFCFSILEIEYARVARYYTPFQTIFLWYIYFFYKVVIEKDHKSFKWILFLSFAGIFMYEGGIFLAILNFTPFILSRGKILKSNVLYSVGVFIVALIYLKIDFRNFGLTNYLPGDVKIINAENFAPLDLPKLFIQTFPNIYWYLLFVIPFSLIIIYGFYLRKAIIEKRISIFFLFFAMLSLFNLYGIIIISFAILYLLNWIKIKDIMSKSFYYLLVILSLNFILYFVFALKTNSWLRFFPEETSISINKILWMFFNYPNFYEKIFIPWFSALPILTSILIIFIASYLIIAFYNSRAEGKESLDGANLLSSIVIFLICLVAILKTPYNDVRYTFFIYPLVLLLLVFAMKSLSDFITRDSQFSLALYSVFFITFVLSSSDYSIYHLLKIDSNEIRFRTIYQPVRENIYYYQEDYLTPAEKINQYMKKEDLVVTTQAPIEYYLRKLDYKYLNYKDGEFTIRSRSMGHKEVWKNAGLIYEEDDLLNLLKNSKSTIWLSDFSNKRPGVSPLEKEINSEFSPYLFYVNFDSTINVFKIPPVN